MSGESDKREEKETTATAEGEKVIVVSPEKQEPHHLHTKWTLWVDYYSSNSSDNWETRLKEVFTVDTVESWWWLYKNIPQASDLPAGANLSLFRKGVKPLPHDERNKDGGEYLVRNFEDDSFNTIWLYSVLFCIGEVSLKDNELVVGTVASVRKPNPRNPQKFSVSMWITTNEKKDEKAVKRLGKFYKEQIGLGARKMRLPFKPHDKSEVPEKKKTDAAAAPSGVEPSSEPAAPQP